MRLPEPIETPGFFWLPEKPENRLPGILRISESGEVKLEAVGSFRDYRAVLEGADIDRIVGMIEEGMLVTLDRCISQREPFGKGLSKSIFYAHFAFIGCACDKQEALQFSKVTFSVDGLNEWLAVSGFKLVGDLESQGCSIHYRDPERISLTLPNEIEMDFSFTHTQFSKLSPTVKRGIEQSSYVSLSLNKPRTVEYLLSLVNQMCLFLSFAVDQNISIEYIQLGDKENPLSSIDMYGEIGHHSEDRSRIRLGEMLFTYENIGRHIEQALTGWIESYEKFEPAFNLYFASRSGDVRYLDVRFLMLAQGMEILHRKSSRESLSLRGRVERMADCFRGLFGGQKQRRCFSKKVADTRNYLTHYSSRDEKKAASEDELMNLYRKVEALFQVHILRQIGFDEKSIEFIARENDVLRDKLGLARSGPLLPSRSPRCVALSLRSAGPRPAAADGG